MAIRQTHTYAELELSPAAYEEIAKKLHAAGYEHAFMHDGAIDMHGIGITNPKYNSIALTDAMIEERREQVAAVDDGTAQNPVQTERDRCADANTRLAHHWKELAAKVRADGTYRTQVLFFKWPFFKDETAVRPNYEKYAAHIEEAANALIFFTEKIIRTGK